MVCGLLFLWCDLCSVFSVVCGVLYGVFDECCVMSMVDVCACVCVFVCMSMHVCACVCFVSVVACVYILLSKNHLSSGRNTSQEGCFWLVGPG